MLIESVPVAERVNLLDLDRHELETFFVALGEKPFRASQILQWVHQQGVTDFAQMSNLSKNLRQRLQEQTRLDMPKLIRQQHSADGTRKWLLQLHDGNCIETVFIPEGDRATLCVSSQVGCVLNCSFCATARQGFNRNLTTAEIIGQLWLAEHSLRQDPEVAAKLADTSSGRVISNVVMMGMGEPLLNLDNVIKAMRLMLDDFSYGLSWRRITLSTAGVVPALERLRLECPVSLAVSLHATRDELRDQLVPLNRKYPIAELLAACKRYVEDDSRCKITVEYVLLQEINDSPQDARALVKLLRGIPAKVNLIPFNPFPQTQYQRSTPERIESFRDILVQANLITVTRKTRGDDIDAACGQLAGSVQDRTRRQQKLATEGSPSV